MVYDVIIIGSGPAGLTAGIYCARFGLTSVILAGTKWGGQLMLTTEVANFPGFGTVMGPDLMKKMRDHVESLGVKVIDVAVKELSFPRRRESSVSVIKEDGSVPVKTGIRSGMTEYEGPFVVKTEQGDFEGKSVIVATGADTRWLGVPNEGKLRGHGLSSCAPCDAFFFKGKPVAVVGGGDSAMEETQVIAKVSPDVVLIHRKDEFRAQKASQDMVTKLPNVRYLYNTQVIDVLGDSALTGLHLYTDPISPKQGVKTLDELVAKFGGTLRQAQGEWELPRAGLFVAIGLVPNTQIFKGLDIDSHGYVKRVEERDENGVLKYFTKTNIAGVFTAGDVHDARYKQAVTAAGFGCMAAIDVERWLGEQ